MAFSKKVIKKKPRINKNLKCYLCESNTKELNYKDLFKLEKFLSRRGKIMPRIRTGACSKHQRDVSNSVKVARFLALI